MVCRNFDSRDYMRVDEYPHTHLYNFVQPFRRPWNKP